MFAETSVRNYQSTTRKIAKECRSHSHPGRSLIHGRFPKRLNCSEMLLTCVSMYILSVKRRFSYLVMSFHFWQLLHNIRHLFLTRKARDESHGGRVRCVVKNMTLGEIFLRILLHFSFPCIEDAPCLVTADLLPAKYYINQLFLPYAPLHLWWYNISLTSITLVRAHRTLVVATCHVYWYLSFKSEIRAVFSPPSRDYYTANVGFCAHRITVVAVTVSFSETYSTEVAKLLYNTQPHQQHCLYIHCFPLGHCML
jgi:hypothetical protein